jgi:hypothetical protein
MNFAATLKISIALLSCGMACAQDFGSASITFVADNSSGYVVSSDGIDAATADRLYRVNLATGAPTMIGALGPTGGVFEDVEGLAIDNSGNLFGVDDDTKTLVNINLSNGRASAVNGVQGNTRLSTGVGNAQDLSLAFSCSGDLFAAARNAKTLYRASTTTGAFEAVTPTGALTGGITDIAVADGQMYGLGDDSLFRIDTAKGTTTAVGKYGSGISFIEGGGLAADGNGQLWAVGERRDSRGDLLPSQIYRINATTGAATLSSSTSVLGIESLVIGTPSCTTALPVSVVSVPSLNVVGALLLVLCILLFGRRFS